MAWQALTRGLSTRFAYPWWAYVLLPLAAIGLEIVSALPQVAYLLLLHPAETWRSTAALLHKLLAHIGGGN